MPTACLVALCQNKNSQPNAMQTGSDYLSHFERHAYTAGGFVWCDRPFYLVNWPQEKWACDFHDDATALSIQLQVTEDFS